jgi:hypothetical protein
VSNETKSYFLVDDNNIKINKIKVRRIKKEMKK